jgi:hypothetical protein
VESKVAYVAEVKFAVDNDFIGMKFRYQILRFYVIYGVRLCVEIAAVGCLVIEVFIVNGLLQEFSTGVVVLVNEDMSVLHQVAGACGNYYARFAAPQKRDRSDIAARRVIMPCPGCFNSRYYRILVFIEREVVAI